MSIADPRWSEVMMLLEKDADMSDTTRIAKLMNCVIQCGAHAYALLDSLYIELNINGGLFRGHKMAHSVDQRARQEVVGYVTALVATLVLSEVADEAQSIIAALEELVFEPEWHGAQPAYRRYLTRYSNVSSDESLTGYRHKVLLILFRQTLMDIWDVSGEFFTGRGNVQRYCEALTKLHEKLEEDIRKTILDSV